MIMYATLVPIVYFSKGEKYFVLCLTSRLKVNVVYALFHLQQCLFASLSLHYTYCYCVG